MKMVLGITMEFPNGWLVVILRFFGVLIFILIPQDTPKNGIVFWVSFFEVLIFILIPEIPPQKQHVFLGGYQKWLTTLQL